MTEAEEVNGHVCARRRALVFACSGGRGGICSNWFSRRERRCLLTTVPLIVKLSVIVEQKVFVGAGAKVAQVPEARAKRREAMRFMIRRCVGVRPPLRAVDHRQVAQPARKIVLVLGLIVQNHARVRTSPFRTCVSRASSTLTHTRSIMVASRPFLVLLSAITTAYTVCGDTIVVTNTNCEQEWSTDTTYETHEAR